MLHGRASSRKGGDGGDIEYKKEERIPGFFVVLPNMYTRSLEEERVREREGGNVAVSAEVGERGRT